MNDTFQVPEVQIIYKISLTLPLQKGSAFTDSDKEGTVMFQVQDSYFQLKNGPAYVHIWLKIGCTDSVPAPIRLDPI